MKWILLIVVVPLAFAAGALVMNRAPLFDSPGFWQRLGRYLTTNVAETRSDHPYAELRPVPLPLGLEQAKSAVVAAMTDLGWDNVLVQPNGVSGVAKSAIFGFKDDVVVRLESSSGEVLVNARSASRQGRGDLAANTRHVRQLFERLAP